MQSKPNPVERDYLQFQNYDVIYARCLINCAADAFVKRTKFERMDVFLGMLNKQTVDDYRNAVVMRGGNGETAIDHLQVAHMKAVRFKADLDEGATILSHLDSAPAEERLPLKWTFLMT